MPRQRFEHSDDDDDQMENKQSDPIVNNINRSYSPTANDDEIDEKQADDRDAEEKRQVAPQDLKLACTFLQVSSAAENIVQKCILRILEGKSFNGALVPRWVDTINQECLNELARLCPNLKYIVSSIVFETDKKSGLHYETTMYWDASTDSSIDVSWENSSVGCIVSVFGIGL